MIWNFTVPEGVTADVTVPGENTAKRYAAGTYTIERGWELVVLDGGKKE